MECTVITDNAMTGFQNNISIIDVIAGFQSMACQRSRGGMVFETDYDFLSALRDAKKNYLTSRDSHFGQLKSRVQEAIVDAASKGKQKASIVVDGFPSEVISDVVGWFQSIGMSADHYTGDQRDPANEIQVGRF